MSVSAVMIAYNEEELLPCCLTFLESMRQITEVVCVVDQDTNDRTISILDHYAAWTNKRIAWKIAKFESFGAQRNMGIDMATQDWLLTLDPDEVFTPQLDDLLKDLKEMPTINVARVPTILLYTDRRHYLDQATTGFDPHVRIWRRNFARYKHEIHEDLIDTTGRSLYQCYDSDVLSTHLDNRYSNVGMKHMQLLKSDAALVGKGLRWQATGALEASAEKGIPVGVNTWLEWKKWAYQTHKVIALPEHLYDITSDW